MAQIDIDKFVISLRRCFGEDKGIATRLDRCLFSQGLKYVDTPTGGRLERVDQPTMLEKIMWGSGEQKPTEEYNITGIGSKHEDGKLGEMVCNLNSAWSEDDKHYYSIIQYCLNNECVGKADKENAISWFKSLKDRVQPKQEWSNWDKTIIESIEALCDEKIKSVVYQDIKEHANDIKEWLKSLRPQSTWKPSNEQLDSLYDVLNPCDGFNREVLESLYQDLKKLKEGSYESI